MISEEQVQAIMSQRTMKIISLAKSGQGTLPKTTDTNVDECKQRTSVELGNSSEEFDSISNWVIEVEPEILKEQFYNAKTNNKNSKGKNSCDDLKCYKLYSTNKTKCYEKGLKSLKLETAFKFRSETVCTKENTILETNENKFVCSAPEREITKLKFDKQNNTSINNMPKTDCNFQIPVIVVPPKEDVAHLSIESNVDLPIIFEKTFSVSKNDDAQKATENFNNFDESETSNSNSFNKYSGSCSIEMATLADNETKKYDITSMDFSENSSELLDPSQLNTPITKKINVLSQYILKPIETITFITEPSQQQNVNEPKTNGVNDFKEDCLNISTELQDLTEKGPDNEEEVEKTIKKHYKDKKTFCFFCDKDVSHFARHLNTWHQNEIEVQRLQAYESKSKERRQALRILTKRGNYVKNRSTEQLRPVRRVHQGIPSSSSEFLPCPHCLGFYKKKTLYRHTKSCDSKPLSAQGKRQCSQSEGQSALLLGKYKHDELLAKELFPRMRADDVSLIAKKDPLICNYAYSYMKGRKSKGNLDFVRTSVRNLAKLLQLSTKWECNIKGLIDLLRPTLFKTIIKGVNIIGGYNETNDVYESPTVALNFGTLLKKCCDLAILQLLQEPDTEARRKEIKILKTLIESQWANEVSAQASFNLNSKKWNKEELLPLTSDLKILKDYLEKIAHETFEELKKNEENKLAYDSLKEILYCQIILMNRRRPAEVAQIKVETYKSINLDVQATEFEGCLTESEKILLTSCSRMVIRGKRGRGVPVLLSQNMRLHFDFLVNVRDNFIENNDYIFHTIGKNFLDGTKVLYKYARKCGIQNPKSITATRLRKHLATVTQLLQFSEADLEQLSRFMGHTLQTHCNFYRLSDSTYQTAKISKLLLLATEGGLKKYKGQDLNSINIDLNPISEDCDVEDIISEHINEDSISTSNNNLTYNLNVQTEAQANKKNAKRASLKHAWSSEQKKIIAKYFAEHVRKKKAPTQIEVYTFLEEYSGLFKDRKWTSIKAIVYNFYTGKLIIPK